jgi:putative membrane protein
MLLRWVFAFLHLTALGIGLGAVWARARALRGVAHGRSLGPVFTADNWWILALTLWLVTGLVRAVAGLERPAAYYAHNDVFWAKMAVFAAVFVLELWPMTTILQWGLWRGRGRPFQPRGARRLAVISEIQAALLVVTVALATAVARGWGTG